MRKNSKYLIIILIIGLLSYYFFIGNNPTSLNKVNFKAKLIDGTEFELKNHKGEYVLIDFWASWCAPCRYANRELVELHKQNPTLTIVTIALEKEYKYAQIAAQKDGFTWRTQIVEEHQFVVQSSLARKFGVSTIPTKFLISPDGKIHKNLSFSEIATIINKE